MSLSPSYYLGEIVFSYYLGDKCFEHIFRYKGFKTFFVHPVKPYYSGRLYHAVCARDSEHMTD